MLREYRRIAKSVCYDIDNRSEQYEKSEVTGYEFIAKSNRTVQNEIRKG